MVMKPYYRKHKYNIYLKANIYVSRWENCREQGYIVSMYSPRKNNTLNIAFFEHRNSDNICAVKWEQISMNSITIETANFGNKYKDKYDVDFEVGYNDHYKMAEWIKEQFDEYY